MAGQPGSGTPVTVLREETLTARRPSGLRGGQADEHEPRGTRPHRSGATFETERSNRNLSRISLRDGLVVSRTHLAAVHNSASQTWRHFPATRLF